MRKEDLEKLRNLNATPVMIKIANQNNPEQKVYGYSGRKTDTYRFGVYMRAQQLDGYLKIALFLADEIRKGKIIPRYEVFINRETGEFITWDTERQNWRNAKIDMLDWPEYKFHSGIYATRDTNRTIRLYLGTESGGFKGVLDYQLNIRTEQLTNKHRRETDPWDQVQEQVPEVPKDWNRWVDKVGITENYIFYKYDKKGAKEGYCTYCEKVVPIKNQKHNADGKCVCCKKKIIYKSIGKAAAVIDTPKAFCWLLQKCETGLVMRQFVAEKTIKKEQYKKYRTYSRETRRIFFSKESTQAFNYELYKNKDMRWCKGSVSASYYGWENGMVYKRNLYQIEIIKKTGLYEILKSSNETDPEICFTNLIDKPYLEKIIKLGLKKLTMQILKGGIIRDIQQSKDFAKCLNIDNLRLKKLREIDGGMIALEWLKYEKKADKELNNQVIKFYEIEGIEPDKIKFILDRMSETKICNYLSKQYELTKRDPKQLLGTWEDYLHMANRLKMNAKVEIIFKPKNLLIAHNDVAELCKEKGLTLKAGEIAEKFIDVETVLENIKSKYEYANKEFTVIAPEKIEDILKEGEILRLCFDRDERYFDRINRRETYLLFLRKTEDIETPYYVLEAEPSGTIRQKRTLGDNQNEDIEAAKKFIIKWQKEIQKKLTKDDELLGVESAKLRLENFNELRKTKAKIRGGCLAGHLLLDVLESDLMEISNTNIESEAS